MAFKLGLMPEIKAHYDIASSTRILIVRDDQEKGRVAELYRWGLIPGWAKDPAIGNKLANARGETVAEKPSFRNAFKRVPPLNSCFEVCVSGHLREEKDPFRLAAALEFLPPQSRIGVTHMGAAMSFEISYPLLIRS